jgi:hypothetical protein
MKEQVLSAKAAALVTAGVIVLLTMGLLGCSSLNNSSTTAAVETTGTAVTATTSAPTTIGAPTTSQPPTTVGATTTTAAAPEIIPGVPSAFYEDGLLSLTRPATSTITNVGFDQYLPLTQSLDVAVILPEDLFAGTNLLEAGVFIGVKAVADLPGPWDEPYGPGEEAAGTSDFAGHTWAVFTASEGAAGNIYEERIYRTVSGDHCFEAVELLHSGRLGNYPEGTVQQFDKAKFEGYLEAMVRSLEL